MSTPPPEVQAAAAAVQSWLDVQSGRLTAEQIAALPPADRIDYARSFDQSKMPAWRDPRTNP